MLRSIEQERIQLCQHTRRGSAFDMLFFNLRVSCGKATHAWLSRIPCGESGGWVLLPEALHLIQLGE